MGNFGIFLLWIVSSGSALANPISMVAVGVNNEVLFQERVEVGGLNLGQLTDQTFAAALAAHDLNNYKGCLEGVISINHLGKGLEVISPSELNAFGWCYEIDGSPLSVLANEYYFTGHESVVKWFYAYSHLSGSVWSAACTPADHVPPSSDIHRRK
jgi:hypothetical protein